MISERTAIVTGGARGIGEAIAKRLSSDGLAVGIIDLDEVTAQRVADEIKSAGGSAVGVGADVTDESAVEFAVGRIAAELGTPTVLVNNAGITRDNLLFKMSTEDWEAVLDVHLKGAFLMSRITQKHMVDAHWGRIINVSSISARGNRGQANYSAAKAGLEGFTKTLSLELGKFGVTANAIAPGYIESEMTMNMAARMGISFEELKSQWASETPVARVGQPGDIAAMASFFARDDASFVSGQVIYVAGGPCV
jgi:3-oxoacyl-[acyl-carrier protein] reductase